MSQELNRHFLLHDVARPHLDRKRQLKRRAVGFERCIGPVSLIFGLERVACEANLRLDAARYTMAQCRDTHKRLPAGNSQRELCNLGRAIGVYDATGLAGAFSNWM